MPLRLFVLAVLDKLQQGFYYFYPSPRPRGPDEAAETMRRDDIRGFLC